MTFRVLLVCAANVCRSPAAAALLRDGLSAPLGEVVAVEHAGLSADSGLEACPRAVRWVAGQVSRAPGVSGVSGSSGAAAVAHRPTRLDVAAIARADLVVALDRDVRAAVLGRGLGQVPDLRHRLFTLVEAAALARGVGAALAGQSGVLRLEPLPAHLEARLRWLVAELDAARGLVPAPRRRGLRGGTPEPDVYDAHAPGGSHRRTLPVLGACVGDLAGVLRQVADVPGVRSAGPEGRRVKR